MKNIVVLISGGGSNLQAIIDHCVNGHIQGSVCAVFSNQQHAYGLKRAEKCGIAAQFVDASMYTDRASYDQELIQRIDHYQPDLLVLAGYMRILSAEFVHHYQGQLINIHPSLLPKYPGLNTYQRAMANGDSEHGTSVHFVTEQLDGGPVILQAKVPIFADDHEDDIKERVLSQEHQIYPLVINWFMTQRLVMHDGAAWLDGIRLGPEGYATE